MAKKKLPVAKAPSTVRDAPYKPSKEDEARERRYRAEDALRSIQRADEIRKDSKLMNDVKQLAKEQMETAKRYCK